MERVPKFPLKFLHSPRCGTVAQNFQNAHENCTDSRESCSRQTPACHRSDTCMYYLEDFSHITVI